MKHLVPKYCMPQFSFYDYILVCCLLPMLSCNRINKENEPIKASLTDSTLSSATISSAMIDTTVSAGSGEFKKNQPVKVQYDPQYFEVVNQLIAKNPLGVDQAVIKSYAVPESKKLVVSETHTQPEVLDKEVVLYAEYATLTDSLKRRPRLAKGSTGEFAGLFGINYEAPAPFSSKYTVSTLNFYFPFRIKSITENGEVVNDFKEDKNVPLWLGFAGIANNYKADTIHWQFDSRPGYARFYGQLTTELSTEDAQTSPAALSTIYKFRGVVQLIDVNKFEPIYQINIIVSSITTKKNKSNRV